MTQNERVLRHLKEDGSLTSAMAREFYGIERLAPRILELKAAGHNIVSTPEAGTNRYGDECRFARYSLVKGEMKQGELL